MRRSDEPGNDENDRYLHFDSMGSVVALSDESGDPAGTYRYEPYGAEVSSPAFSQPLRFQGQYLDTSTGLYKMGLRYQDPELGRWTQKDPLNLFRDPRQANRYSFAGADPVNQADPSGKQIICPIIDLFDACEESPINPSSDVLEEVPQFVGGCAVGAIASQLSPPGLFNPLPMARAYSAAAACGAGGGAATDIFD